MMMAERKGDKKKRDVERKDDRKEPTTCQDAMKANPEKMGPTEGAIAILEQMFERLLAGQEEMEAK
jgi:hypothetical protein